jgi:hypothetical protein
MDLPASVATGASRWLAEEVSPALDNQVSRFSYPWHSKPPAEQRLQNGRPSSHLTCLLRHVQQPVNVLPRRFPATFFWTTPLGPEVCVVER